MTSKAISDASHDRRNSCEKFADRPCLGRIKEDSNNKARRAFEPFIFPLWGIETVT